MRIKQIMFALVAVAALSGASVPTASARVAQDPIIRTTAEAPAVAVQHDAVVEREYPLAGTSNGSAVAAAQHDATMPRDYPLATTPAVPVSAPTGGGFDWLSAAIGGALAVALLLTVPLMWTGVSRRRDRGALA